MDRRAWRATVYGVTRVLHDLVIKSPPPVCDYVKLLNPRSRNANYLAKMREDLRGT